MTIEKKLDEDTKTYEYSFKKENLEFKIFYGGNLDLYWEIIDHNVNEDNFFDYETKPLEFIIDKDNMEIYSLFLTLYEEVINKRFESKEEQENLDLLLDGLDTIKNFADKELEDTYNLLVKDGVISWHSDETYYEAANIADIETQEDSIKITFIEQMPSDFSIPGRVSVRFRNSGSTYDPFNRMFMNHFNALEKIDSAYHQIHIDEYVRKLKQSTKNS